MTVIVILAAIIGAYVLGLELSRRDIAGAKQLVQQLQTESQRLKRQIVEQNAQLVGLRSNLTSTKATLEEIMPTKDTFKISPNQSLIVADGRLTIGLIGSPTNQNINININGKQQLAVTGDTIDASPGCRVKVQSFDMFKAIVTAACQ